jgi:hypothetical protein
MRLPPCFCSSLGGRTALMPLRGHGMSLNSSTNLAAGRIPQICAFRARNRALVLSGILIAAGQQPRAHLLSTRHTVARLYVSSKRALPAHTLDRPPFPRHHRQAGRGPLSARSCASAISGKSASTKSEHTPIRRRRYHFAADSGKRKPLSARIPCWLVLHWRPHHIRLGTHRSPGHANRLRTRFSDSDRTRSIVPLGLR